MLAIAICYLYLQNVPKNVRLQEDIPASEKTRTTHVVRNAGCECYRYIKVDGKKGGVFK